MEKNEIIVRLTEQNMILEDKVKMLSSELQFLRKEQDVLKAKLRGYKANEEKQ